MKKKIFIFSIIVIILVVGFTFAKETIAGASDNVWGWAWADTIGWISFNSTNCDSNGDGITDQINYSQCSIGQTIKNYGVNIDSSGLFSGYAWSSNIGWISFDDFDGGHAQAQLTFATNQVSGWARALANGDGWDGWIKLNGVSLNSSIPAPFEFEGWAWGSDVVGWISFNHSNTGAAVDYKVMTDLSINNFPPTAAISCNPPSCEVYETEILQLINNSTDLDGEMDIFQSIWSIDSDEKTSCFGKCNFTPQTWVGIGSYAAKLYVEDTAVQSDTAAKDFKIKKDITADFKCSLDNINWQTCEDINAIDGKPFYFQDDSLASEGASINSRVWEKDASAFDSDNNTNPSLMTATIPSMIIKLTASDTAIPIRSASKTHTIGVKMQLPTWREIFPF